VQTEHCTAAQLSANRLRSTSWTDLGTLYFQA